MNRLSRFNSIYRAENAFTLIELLVVIAIIAILAAILFPVFAQAREKARQTVCLSNTKQLGLGVMQYVQDYDEVYPMGGYSSGSMTADAKLLDRWYKAVAPYIKNNVIRACPSAKNTPTDSVTNYQTNYGVQADICRFGGGSLAVADLKAPAGTLLFAEAEMVDLTTVNRTDSTTWLQAETNSPADWDVKGLHLTTNGSYFTTTDKNNARWPAPRHNGGLNVGFCDGHSKWVKIDQLTGVSPARHDGWPLRDSNNLWDNY